MKWLRYIIASEEIGVSVGEGGGVGWRMDDGQAAEG